MHDNRVLVISPIGCGPPHSGNRTRIRTLLQELKSLGYQVHFAWAQIPDETTWARLSEEERLKTNQYVDQWVCDFKWDARTQTDFKTLLSKARHTVTRLTRIGRERKSKGIYRLDQWFHPAWIKQAKELQHKQRYSRVIVTYVFSSAFFKAFPTSVLKILDCHDVFTCRNDVVSHDTLTVFWYSIYKSDERRALMRSNHIIGIQDAEAAFFKQLINGQRPVFTVGHFSDVAPLEFSPDCVQSFGFVASDYPANIDGLEWFLCEVWPMVKKQRASSRLIIGGSIGRASNLADDDILDMGVIESPDRLYSRILFSINPIRLGTGLKIKTVEALSRGRAVITTLCGSSGLESYLGRGIELAQSPEEVANSILALLANPEMTKRSGSIAAQTAQDINANSRKALADAMKLI
jgi:polysaccharide biosynthesis protein PslH